MKKRPLCRFYVLNSFGKPLGPWQAPYDTWVTDMQGQNSSHVRHGVGVVIPCLLPLFSTKASRQWGWKSTEVILQGVQSTYIELPPPTLWKRRGVNNGAYWLYQTRVPAAP